MKNFTVPIVAILSLMLFKTALYAQKKDAGFMQWKIAATFPAGVGQPVSLGFAGPVAGVHNNVLLVGGGANFPDSMPWRGGKKKYYNDLYVFEKEKNKTVPLKKSFQLPVNIAYTANCSTPGGILIAGGENENGISSKVFLLRWNTAAQTVEIKSLPDLPFALTNASATNNENKVYVAGGETASAASDKLFSLDLDNVAAGWQQLPSIPKPVSHAVFVVQGNGRNLSLFLLGGRKKNASGISDLYSSVYEFDLIKEQWTQKSPLPYNLCAGTGIANGASCILMLGGDKGETFHKAETMIAAINAEKDETKKQELILQKNKVQSTHPGFSKEVLQYNTLTDEWVVYDSIPFDVPVTTTAVRWGNDVIIPSGEIRAGVRSPGILKGKLCR
jgi:cyclically-permuted mutarotase family protein